MSLITRTALTLIVNILIIASFFVFVNCFNKQEMWPLVVSGIFMVSFVFIKISSANRSQARNRHYR
jgi:hypothetical protein